MNASSFKPSNMFLGPIEFVSNNFTPSEPAFEYQAYSKPTSELSRADREIIEKLNVLCFDQGGCRMI